MSLFEHDDFIEQMTATGMSAIDLTRQRARNLKTKFYADPWGNNDDEQLRSEMKQNARRAWQKWRDQQKRKDWQMSWLNMCKLIVAKREADEIAKAEYSAKQRVTLGHLMRNCATRYGFTIADIRSDRRGKNLALCRQEFFYLARKLTHFSLPAIGKYTGDKDHTTVLHGARRYERLMRIKAGLEKQEKPGDRLVDYSMVLDMGHAEQ